MQFVATIMVNNKTILLCSTQSLVLHKLLYDDKLSGRRYKLETGLKGSIHILSHLQSIKALRGKLARELQCSFQKANFYIC